jgi:hypothetical protein
MPDDKLAPALYEIRARGYRNGATGALCGRLSDCAAIDVPRLLAAVDVVLALAEIYDDGDSLVDPAAAIRTAVGKALGVTDA